MKIVFSSLKKICLLFLLKLCIVGVSIIMKNNVITLYIIRHLTANNN